MQERKGTEIFRKGFAFVIQGDSTQWSAIRGPNVMAERGKTTPPLFEYKYGALVIEFTARYNPAIMEESHSVACYEVHPRREGNKRISPLYSVWCSPFFDGKSHLVKIEYNNTTSSLHVWMLPQEKALLHVEKKNLRSSGIQLEFLRSCGVQLEDQRAWVGFMAATGDDAQWQSQAIHIESWKFQLKEKKFGNEIDSSPENKIREAWKRLRIGYHVKSPLDLVLLEEGFDRYNVLWHFLLDVKRVQLNLNESFYAFKDLRKKNRRNTPPKEYRVHQSLLFLRARMQFLVNNIQFYLQVDVLEAQFHALREKIEDSQDFDTVRDAHKEYLSTITNHCFLRDRTVFESLNLCFKLCSKFCSLVGTRKLEISQTDVNQMTEEFDSKCLAIYDLVDRKSRLHGSPHLTQLSMRINYNDYLGKQLKNRKRQFKKS